jgi:hypothetical protein
MNSTTASRRAAFRQHVAARQGLLLAGAFNAMSARIIEDLGFGAVYLTGAGVTNMSLGLPDLGFIGLSDMAEHAARVGSRHVCARPAALACTRIRQIRVAHRCNRASRDALSPSKPLVGRHADKPAPIYYAMPSPDMGVLPTIEREKA